MDVEPSAAEREAADRVMRQRRWTLNQTLAWIATCDPDAVAQDCRSSALSAWMAIQMRCFGVASFPHPTPGEAWHELRSALADRALQGLGTMVNANRAGGLTAHAVGVPFPPDDQRGFAEGCDVFEEGGGVVAPTGRPFHQTWTEFRNLTFSRADVMREFPLVPIIVEAEFEEVEDRPQIAAPLTSETAENEKASKPSPEAQVSSGGPDGEEYGPNRPTIRAVCDAYLSAWDEAGRPNELRPQERTLLPRVLALCKSASRAKYRAVFEEAREPYDADWSTAGRKTGR